MTANSREIKKFFDSPFAITTLINKDTEILFSNKLFARLQKSSSVKQLSDILTEQSKQDIKTLFENNVSKGTISLEIKDTGQVLEAEYLKFLYENKNCLLLTCEKFMLKQNEDDIIHTQRLEIIGQMASSVIHDFNNLLTIVLNSSESLMMEYKSDKKLAEELSLIYDNCIRGAEVIKPLLNFSNKYNIEDETKIENINFVVNDIDTLLQKAIGSKINFVIDTSNEPILARINKYKLEQIILNLAINARDAMKSGGSFTIKTGSVCINEESELKDYYLPMKEQPVQKGKYAMISLSDTGSGIDKEIIDKIFEPFFSTKDITHGSGLGLSIILNILKEAGGYLLLETKKDIGTTFIILLKMVDVPSLPEKTTKKSMENKKIILAEDDTQISMLTNYALTNEGYSVLVVDTANAVLEILKRDSTSIGLVISDVMMPGLSTVDMMKEVNTNYPEIKFILTSGYSEGAVPGLKALNYKFMSKPYAIKKLVALVKMVLNEK